MNKRRIIMMFGSVTIKSMASVTASLIDLASESNKPIILLINSEGGTLTAALSLCDLIRCLGVPVYGVVCGAAFSSAFVILQACHKRYMTPMSQLMTHEGTVGVANGVPQEVRSGFRSDMYNFRKCVELVAARTGKTIKEIRALDAKTTYFTPESALVGNFCDGILTGSILGLGNFNRKKSPKKRKS